MKNTLLHIHLIKCLCLFQDWRTTCPTFRYPMPRALLHNLPWLPRKGPRPQPSTPRLALCPHHLRTKMPSTDRTWLSSYHRKSTAFRPHFRCRQRPLVALPPHHVSVASRPISDLSCKLVSGGSRTVIEKLGTGWQLVSAWVVHKLWWVEYIVENTELNGGFFVCLETPKARPK